MSKINLIAGIVLIMVIFSGCMKVEEENTDDPAKETQTQEMAVYRMEMLDMDVEAVLKTCDKAAGQDIGGWKFEDNELGGAYIGKNKSVI